MSSLRGSWASPCLPRASTTPQVNLRRIEPPRRCGARGVCSRSPSPTADAIGFRCRLPVHQSTWTGFASHGASTPVRSWNSGAHALPSNSTGGAAEVCAGVFRALAACALQRGAAATDVELCPAGAHGFGPGLLRARLARQPDRSCELHRRPAAAAARASSSAAATRACALEPGRRGISSQVADQPISPRRRALQGLEPSVACGLALVACRPSAEDARGCGRSRWRARPPPGRPSSDTGVCLTVRLRRPGTACCPAK